MEKIKADVADLFREVFTEKLGGWTVVTILLRLRETLSRRMPGSWADILRDRLDEFHGK